MSPTRTEPFVLDLAVQGFIEPLSRRSAFKMSRLAVLADGSTVPVLELLARKRFTKWEEDQFPFWIDGDRTNETLGNVGLATRTGTGKRTRSAFGVPAGTKEYMKLWRAANRDRVRRSQAKYNEKQRETLAIATDIAASSSDPVLTKLLALVKGGKEDTTE